MKRERLFRGKREDNHEWVYGSLLIGFTGISYIVTMHDHILGMTEMSEVIPGSVGQYTGLKDKDGKEIYEGDIVRISIPTGHLDNVEQIAKVVFENGCFKFEYAPFRSSIFDGYAPGCIFEIIENVHEHPELLNTK